MCPDTGVTYYLCTRTGPHKSAAFSLPPPPRNRGTRGQDATTVRDEIRQQHTPKEAAREHEDIRYTARSSGLGCHTRIDLGRQCGQTDNSRSSGCTSPVRRLRGYRHPNPGCPERPKRIRCRHVPGYWVLRERDRRTQERHMHHHLSSRPRGSMHRVWLRVRDHDEVEPALWRGRRSVPRLRRQSVLCRPGPYCGWDGRGIRPLQPAGELRWNRPQTRCGGHCAVWRFVSQCVCYL